MKINITASKNSTSKPVNFFFSKYFETYQRGAGGHVEQ